eukprot:NODE_1203_length_1527_cov_5.096752_g998_i0.p5 GENE.NODE_1203_length_1527_cov_5.096752_g998_i0~~NODE_1203_length_1527_cov_5.096752_g998_i0.p5  ORF type:complete len:77 (-),score=9.92 NODE_1203_length_1527_cov_5.096752_g998_i0:1124-1354(-)
MIQLLSREVMGDPVCIRMWEGCGRNDEVVVSTEREESFPVSRGGSFSGKSHPVSQMSRRLSLHGANVCIEVTQSNY